MTTDWHNISPAARREVIFRLNGTIHDMRADGDEEEIAALEALGDERDERGTTVVGWRIKSVRAARDRIRARTTPATLSTDTLAAIAEARGLRVVEPELVAEVPVLRWECDLHSIARFGQWVLEADADEWTVWVDSPGPRARLLVAGATTERTERAVNRRAAEAAMRKLGVAFRTE